MAKVVNAIAIVEETIISKIFFIRDQKVMPDRDLAQLYDATTGNLNEAVKRNVKRFPHDFMFQLTRTEFDNLIFQSGISSWGGTRRMPYAFTEQGVAMLSSVLSSDRAVEVNIRIIRIFTKLRTMLLTHKDILLKLAKVEKELIQQGSRTRQNEDIIPKIFTALKQLLNPPNPPREPIGFKVSK